MPHYLRTNILITRYIECILLLSSSGGPYFSRVGSMTRSSAPSWTTSLTYLGQTAQSSSRVWTPLSLQWPLRRATSRSMWPSPPNSPTRSSAIGLRVSMLTYILAYRRMVGAEEAVEPTCPHHPPPRAPWTHSA